MNVLFIDFDGVLLPQVYKQSLKKLYNKYGEKGVTSKDKYGYYFAPWAIEALNYIISMRPDMKIVISSDWRKIQSKESLQEMWKYRKYPGEIIGVTPILLDIRGEEVKQWLAQWPAQKYAVIDDRKDFYGDQKVFNTCFDTGLTMDLAREIVSYF